MNINVWWQGVYLFIQSTLFTRSDLIIFQYLNYTHSQRKQRGKCLWVCIL